MATVTSRILTLIGDVSVFTREVVLRDTGATQVKFVAFVPRKPGMTREEFQDYWEHGHGPVFLGVPDIDAHVTKYVQNHVIGFISRNFLRKIFCGAWPDAPAWNRAGI